MRKPAPQAAPPSPSPGTARLAIANERLAAPAAPSVSPIENADKPASRAAAPQAAGSPGPADS